MSKVQGLDRERCAKGGRENTKRERAKQIARHALVVRILEAFRMYFETLVHGCDTLSQVSFISSFSSSVLANRDSPLRFFLRNISTIAIPEKAPIAPLEDEIAKL